MAKQHTNQLELIVQKSGLVEAKAKILLDNFSDYFKIAAEWETKARTIEVNNEDQIADMMMARTGRLFLRQKRIAIEKTRKQLKEQSLREGKAIDGVANILKSLIVPIEEYLERQERFVEIKEAERRAAEQRVAEEKAEKERIKQERIEAERREAERKELEKLRKETRAKDLKIAEEKAKVEAEKKKVEKVKVERSNLKKKLANTIRCPYCHKEFTLKEGGQ